MPRETRPARYYSAPLAPLPPETLDPRLDRLPLAQERRATGVYLAFLRRWRGSTEVSRWYNEVVTAANSNIWGHYPEVPR